MQLPDNVMFYYKAYHNYITSNVEIGKKYSPLEVATTSIRTEVNCIVTNRCTCIYVISSQHAQTARSLKTHELYVAHNL